MYIVVDKHIPYLHGLLEQIAQVDYLEPKDITPAAVKAADVLIVRTRTRCDRALLEGSRVRLILTATIGYDHIDAAYCAEAGISWCNAPGCNADGVCDYVESAMRETGTLVSGKTLGIIGVGEVGGRVCRMATQAGMRVLLCDPPRADKEGWAPFVSYETIARMSDVITLHPTLTRTGEIVENVSERLVVENASERSIVENVSERSIVENASERSYPSYHLVDEAFLSLTRSDALIINAARGGIVDEEALLSSGRRCVIDCWEGEISGERLRASGSGERLQTFNSGERLQTFNSGERLRAFNGSVVNSAEYYSAAPSCIAEAVHSINTALVQKAELATPHIAGYTQWGKYRASDIVLRELTRFFGLPPIRIPKDEVPLHKTTVFDIRRVSDELKANPENFEQQREHYPLR